MGILWSRPRGPGLLGYTSWKAWRAPWATAGSGRYGKFPALELEVLGGSLALVEGARERGKFLLDLGFALRGGGRREDALSGFLEWGS